MPGIVFRRESITAVPFALSSISFAVACGHRFTIASNAALVSVNDIRFLTWSIRYTSAPRRAHTCPTTKSLALVSLNVMSHDRITSSTSLRRQVPAATSSDHRGRRSVATRRAAIRHRSPATVGPGRGR